MDKNAFDTLINSALRNINSIELLVREDTASATIEARTLLPKLEEILTNLRSQLQATRPEGMTAKDVRDALESYADNVQPQIYISEDIQPGYCLIEKITDLHGTSPTIPIIDLGCEAT
jgi:hypothetical protein